MCSTLTGPFCNVEYWSSNSSCHGCASCYNCNNCTLCATPPGVWTADFAAVKGPALKRGKCGSALDQHCGATLLFLANHLGHSEQMYGFSPVWLRSCSVFRLWLLNCLGQNEQ